MSTNLTTYLHDHLAGARFAISLLDDLASQDRDEEVADFAAALLPEIQADQSELQALVDRLDSQPSMIKEASAWLTQKLSGMKFQLNSDSLGVFEALELLSLGILGKVALWKALETVESIPEVSQLDLHRLIQRAQDQHARAEEVRLRYARHALTH
jgi:hypothetical protein